MQSACDTKFCKPSGSGAGADGAAPRRSGEAALPPPQTEGAAGSSSPTNRFAAPTDGPPNEALADPKAKQTSSGSEKLSSAEFWQLVDQSNGEPPVPVTMRASTPATANQDGAAATGRPRAATALRGASAGFTNRGRERVDRLRAQLTNVDWLCAELGIASGARRQQNGLVVQCPWHDDATPSCSLRTTATGAIYARCFGCGHRGDVFALIAQVRGLDVRTQFSAVLREAQQLADEMLMAAPEDRLPAGNCSLPDLPDDVFGKLAETLLGVCSIDAAPDVCAYLERRGLLDQARSDGWGALPPAAPAQADVVGHLCAVHGEESWLRSGLSPRFWSTTAFTFSTHRLLIPWRGPDGSILGLQRRILPPADHGRADKYVFSRGRSPRAPYGVDKLAGGNAATELAFLEGAVDVLAMRVLCERRGRERVALGVPGVTNWRTEWALLAAGRVVHVAFDADAAGDKASGKVGADLHRAGATRVLRTRPSDAKDWAEIVERGSR